MSAVGGVVLRAQGTAVPAGSVDGTPISTLPPVDGITDQLSAIFALASQLTRTENEVSRRRVLTNKLDQSTADRQRREALERAKQESEKGGIFKELEDNIGLLGVFGLATFNYGLVAADIVLHESGAVGNLRVDLIDGACAAVAQTHPEILVADVLLRKLDATPDAVERQLDALGLGTNVPGISDEDVKPVVDTAVKLNLLIAGTAASVLTAGSTTALVVALVAAAFSAGAFASEQANGPVWLTLGLQVCGAALSLGAGLEGANAALSASESARIAQAKAVGIGVTALNGGLHGTDTVLHSVHQHAADEANIDAAEAKMRLARLQRLLDELIDTVEENEDSRQRTTESVREAIETHGRTLLTASSLKA